MLPDSPGSYVLVLRLHGSTQLDVGCLGAFTFPSGWYAYAGSARGPGGLASRVRRHIRTHKPHHWHIDFLRAHSEVVGVWYAEGTYRCECEWAEALLRLRGASPAAVGFGASDCRCKTHLAHLVEAPNLASFRASVKRSVVHADLTSVARLGGS
jgi:Uri superfamily endonuclease